MMRFQKLIRNLFLILHGHNVRLSSGNCPSFSCSTSSSLLMLNAGSRDQFPRWRRSRKRLSVCSVLRCPDLWLHGSVSFVHETWTVAAAEGVRFARVKWEINFLLIFETAPFFCKHPVYIHIYIYIYTFGITLTCRHAGETVMYSSTLLLPLAGVVVNASHCALPVCSCPCWLACP